MTDAATLSPPDLHLAGVYRRRVGASLARIWENVYDWEHLPALHEGTFRSVELIERCDLDWTVRFGGAGGGPPELIRLKSDQAARRYEVTTLEGGGVGSQIRVQLTAIEPHVTDVEVGYHVPEARPERLARIGAGFVAMYERLWDEDEAMMQRREAQLRARRRRFEPTEPVVLGPVAEVDAALPVTAEFGGEPFRVMRDGGQRLAHAAACPHWLGPLDETPVENGAVRCPWHGWRFDVRTGENLEGHACRLPTPPRVVEQDGRLVLIR